MKKRAKKEIKTEPENKRNFVWYSTRISFGLMILSLLISSFVNLAAINLLFILSSLFCVVVSMIHLFKYKKKAFAIVALVISGLLFLLYVIGSITY